jgi:hypothetical protein
MKQADSITQKAKKRFSWRILWENFVFQDGDHYYKMPTSLYKRTMYHNSNSYEKVVSALILIKKYFWPLVTIPKTEVLKDKDGNYVIKQQEILWKKLSRKTLEDNPKLLSKFSRIVIANEIMWEEQWFFLDLLGSDILIHPNTIHNLFSDGENIYIFDFWLLEKSSKSILFKYFSQFWIWFQLRFIKRYF